MSITLTSLYQDVCSELGQGTGNNNIASKFVRAVNRALDQLAIRSDKATKFTAVTSTSGTVTLDAHYEYVLYAGVAYWMVRMGVAPSDPKIATIVYQDTANRWNEATGEYVMDLDNINQSDDENDVTKLGAVSV